MFKCKRLLATIFLSLTIMSLFNLETYAGAPYPHIFAESAVLIDAKTGKVLYGKSEHTRHYPASITKLLTALVAIENLEPTDTITMSQEAVFSIERGSSHIGLDVGEQISLDQGLRALLLASANEVANGIAELSDGSISDFADHSTRRAKELGANNTNFTNPHGLHNPDHYTTAYDMALISRELVKQPYFMEIMNTPTYQIPPTNKCDEIRYLSQPHKLLHERRFGKSYREDVIGGKTGYTTIAGNTLVTMAKRGDIELIAVVLKSNSANLYTDTNLILDYGFENYKTISLHQQENIVDTLPIYTIKSGELVYAGDCDVRVEECVNLLANSKIKEQMIVPKITLPPRVDDKVHVGDVVGSISYDYEGELLSTHNLVVQEVKLLPEPSPPSLAAKVIESEELKPTISLSIRPDPLFLPYVKLIVAAILLATIIALFLKHRHKHKMRQKGKKLLRFSKTMK